MRNRHMEISIFFQNVFDVILGEWYLTDFVKKLKRIFRHLECLDIQKVKKVCM